MKQAVNLIFLIFSAHAIYVQQTGLDPSIKNNLGSAPETGSLEDYGFLPVTNYGAKPDDGIDDTLAVQQTINDAFSNNMVCFFPEGTYNISDTLECWQPFFYDSVNNTWASQLRHAHVLAGSTRGKGAVIVLKNQAAGFTDEYSHKALFQFWCASADDPVTKTINNFTPGSHYNAEIKNLTIDLGYGNTGAAGIFMVGAQGCSIQDIIINAHDAFAGLYGLPGACSTVAKIRITGGRYGIYGSVSDKMIGGVQPGVNDQLLIGITLENQLENAVYWERGFSTFNIIGFRIISAQAHSAIILKPFYRAENETLNLIDGSIELLSAGAALVDNQGNKSVCMQNVYGKADYLFYPADSSSIVAGSAGSWKKISSLAYLGSNSINILNGLVDKTRLMSAGITSVLTVDSAELVAKHLWKCDFICFEDRDCVNAKKFGVKGDGLTDDTAALQNVLNIFNKVFLPKGIYLISSGITLGANNKLTGIAKNLTILKSSDQAADGSAASPKYLIKTISSITALTQLAFLEIQPRLDLTNTGALQWMAGKNSIIRNIQLYYNKQGAVYRNTAEFMFSGNAGGKYYGLHHALGGKDAYGSGAIRTFLFDHTSNAMNIYYLNPELTENSPSAEIRNCKNMQIFAYKDENTFSTLPKYDRLHINNSTNIAIHGASPLINYTAENIDIFKISGSDNILFNNFARFLTVAGTDVKMLFSEDFNNDGIPECSVDAVNMITKYISGSFTEPDTRIYNLLTDTFSSKLQHWCGDTNYLSCTDGIGTLPVGKTITLGCYNYDDYRLEICAKSTGGDAVYQVLRFQLRKQETSGKMYEVRLQTDKKIVWLKDGVSVKTSAVTAYSPDLYHNFIISVTGEKIGMTIDNVYIDAYSDPDYTYTRGSVGLFSGSNCTGSIDSFYIKDYTLY